MKLFKWILFAFAVTGLCYVTAVAEEKRPLEAAEATAESAQPVEAPKYAPKHSNFSDWTKDAEPRNNASIFKMFEGLAYCLGVFFIGFHFYRKFFLKQQKRIEKTMRLIEKLPLTPKTALVLVEVEKKKYLVSVGSERTSFVTHSAGNSLSEYLEISENELAEEKQTLEKAPAQVC